MNGCVPSPVLQAAAEIGTVSGMHVPKTKAYALYNTGLQYPVAIPNNCICNEERALRERHLVQKNVQLDVKLWNECARRNEKWFNWQVQPCSMKEILKSYKGNKLRTYERALVYLSEYGLQPKHSRVSMFVKNERFPKDKIEVKPPRAIQYRSPEFNLCMMKFTRKLEENYNRMLFGVVSGLRPIVKGLNNEQRAELLLEKLSWFERPKFIEVDHSAFDSTISEHHLKTTHRKYRKVFGRRCKWIFSQQIDNRGRTRHGIKYRVRGTRMSGDADTALGNCIVNCDAITGVLWKSGIEKYDMIVDGDDSVIVVEHDAVVDYGLFKQLGLETKYQEKTKLAEVDFCQSRMIFRPEPIWVRNPVRAISNGALCKKWYKNFGDWLAAYGMCEAAVNQGVPVMQAFGEALAKLSTKPAHDRDIERRMELRGEVKKKEITTEARMSFWESFGTPPPLQIMLEEEIAKGIWCNSWAKTSEHVKQLSRAWTWSEYGPQSSSSSWWCCS